MDTQTNNKIIPLIKGKSIIVNDKINDSIKSINDNASVIYFAEEINNRSEILSLLNNKLIDNITIVSKNHIKSDNEKVNCISNINTKVIKRLKSNIIIIINLNDDYNYLRYIVKNLFRLFNISVKHNKYIGIRNYEEAIICSIIHNNSIYFEDLVHVFKAIFVPTAAEKYEFIYDTVCDYLDKQFTKNNYCDFCNDQCGANRENRSTGHKTMGCCYSFDYASLFELKLVKNVKLCQYMQNKTCATKNITCKLFTCKYLRGKNIKFDTHKILLLDCFFNKKQHEIITSNFFKTREQILEKLLEKNNDTYLWYYISRKYMIKN